MTERPSIDKFSTAKDEAFALTEAHTPALADQYASVFRRAGRRAARRFKTSARLVSLQAAGFAREEDGLELVAASETPGWAVPPIDELLDVVQVTQDLLGTTEKTREAAAVSAVRPITSTMGVSFELEAPLVKDLVSKAGVRAAKISIPGLRDAVYFAIKQAFEQGLSVDQTAALIYEKADNLASYQAEMLARTDLIGTANGGSLLAAKTVWPQGGVTKRWVNATDSNTENDGRIRPTHMEANGQEVPIDGHFIVGGARMMYPGDPAGSDEEVINCRCVIVYHDALQAAAWDESKHPREPSGKREGGRFARATGPVTGMRKLEGLATNGVYTADLDGQKVIVKPETGLTATRLREYVEPGSDLVNEAAAARVAQILAEEAPDVAVPVPPYRIMDVEEWYGRSGVQPFIEGDTVAYLANTDPARVGGNLAPVIRDVRLYDGIIGNTDRHDGNLILDRAGELHAIDHGLAFPTRNYAKDVSLQGGWIETELNGEQRSALERVRTRIQSDQEITELLSPAQLAETDKRIGYMLDSNRLPTVDDWQTGFGEPLEQAA